MLSELERRVWEAVRDRPCRKGLPVDELPALVGVPYKDVRPVVDWLVGQGRLYWRDPRQPRRLLHVPERVEPTVSTVDGGLW